MYIPLKASTASETVSLEEKTDINFNAGDV